MPFEYTTYAEINPNAETLEAGRHTFQIQGASADEKDPGTVIMKLAIVSEGDAKGRSHTERFWNPAKAKEAWQGKQTLKDFRRLQLVIGLEPLPAAEENVWGIFGEEPVDYLNRAARENAQFSAEVVHKPSKKDPDTKYANLKMSSLSVAM